MLNEELIQEIENSSLPEAIKWWLICFPEKWFFLPRLARKTRY